MNELSQQIQGLNGPQVAEAVKNLRLALQFHWQRKVDDQEVKQALQAVNADGDAEALRQSIIAEEESAAAMERWGRSLLIYAASDPDLRPHVNEAVDDALKSSVKDFGIASLLILGAVVVLLKWRPKKFERNEKGTKIEWEDNDVSAVADLAKAAAGTPS